MSRHEPFEERFERYETNLSEVAFERLFSGSFVRLGLDRAEIDVRQWPAIIRHLPDYATNKALIEVVGCNGDTLRLKQTKLKALMQWHSVYPTYLFVLNVDEPRWAMPLLPEVAALTVGLKPQYFNDSSVYFGIPTSNIEGWQRYPYPLRGDEDAT